MSQATDIELLDRWCEGEMVAGDALFSRHFAAVHRFFRNKVASEVLEDLVQQTFMVCVEGQSRFRQESQFKTYLFGVAHNLLRVHYRKKKQRSAQLDFGRACAADLAAGPSTLFGKRREERLLLEALRRIPLDSQVVLELYYWEEMSAAQTAAVLELAEGTVRGRVARAKKLLGEELAKLTSSAAELQTTLQGLEQWAAALRERLRRQKPD